MEGAAVAHVAARNDVPALVIRALSDNADTDYEDFKTFDISRIRGHRRETDGEHRQTHVAFMWRCETPNVAKSRFHIPFAA